MFLRKLKETRPENIVLIIVIAILIWAISFINPVTHGLMNDSATSMPLYSILERITGGVPFVGVIVSFFIVLLVSYLMIDFNTSEIFMGERTFLPGLLYILLTGLFPNLRMLNPVLPAAPFLILAVRKIIDTYKVNGTAYNFFDAGLLIGTGSLFYSGFIWYGLMLFIGMIIIRSVNLREFIISVAGLAAPLFIAFGIMYLSDADLAAMTDGIRNDMFTGRPVYANTIVLRIILALLSVILLIGIASLVSRMNTQKIKARKTFILLFWIFFISILLLFIFRSVSLEIFWFAGIPAGYFISYFILHSRNKTMPGIVLGLILLMAAFVQLYEILD